MAKPSRGTSDKAIGIFDSGFGGLTVARAVIDLLPGQDLVYFGDTGRYPYGPRDLEEVRGFAHQISAMLLAEHDVGALVVACNTASAAALDGLQATLPVPVIGVIDPGARALVEATRNGRVGVIGTVGTIGSGSYQRAVADEVERVAGDRATGGGSADPDIDLVCAACPGFVEFVERGVVTGDEITVLAERLLAPVREAKVDTLLLGCTHYPYLARVIGDVMGSDVVLVSSADETAFALRSLLTDAGIARDPADGTGTHTFCSSGDVDWFRALGRRLLGPELVEARPVTFEGP